MLFSKQWPLLVIDYITAPNIYGCQNGTPTLGTTLFEAGKDCTRFRVSVLEV